MKLESVDDLAHLLVSKWDYLPSQSLGTAEKLLQMESNIRVAFEEWLATGRFPDRPVILGFSPLSLSDMVELKPPAIFLLLDWIWREPEEAVLAMKQEFSSGSGPFASSSV